MLEAANGLGHSTIALSRGEYFPEVIIAPALPAFSVALGARLLSRD